MFGIGFYDDRLLYTKNGGHGMLFESFDKEHMFIQHMPNKPPYERPCVFKVDEKDDTLFLYDF